MIGKVELMREIEREWTALQEWITRLSQEEMTRQQDDAGWTVKDHLIHLIYWERSVTSLLLRRPRYQGLGVSEALYLQDNDDAINDVVYQAHRERPLPEVLDKLQRTHGELLALLAPLTDTDLQTAYRDYLPQEPGQGQGPPIIEVIYDNTAGHYGEHLPWMEALVAADRD